METPTAELPLIWENPAVQFWRDVAIVEGEIKPAKGFFETLVWNTWTGKSATDLEQTPALACHKYIRERGGIGHDEEPLTINVLTRPVTARDVQTAMCTVYTVTRK